MGETEQSSSYSDFLFLLIAFTANIMRVAFHSNMRGGPLLLKYSVNCGLIGTGILKTIFRGNKV
jgi:hypothetical protein